MADPRFPHGTLALQIPWFAEGGVDLSRFHRGTINLDTAPWRFEPRAPRVTLRSIQWHATEPPEDFSFFDCLLVHEGREVRGLVYRPHPETKPEHPQPPTVIELLTPWLRRLTVGAQLHVRIDPDQAAFVRS